MKHVTMNVDGEMFTLDDMNEEIYKNLEPTIKRQLERKEENKSLKRPIPLRFGAVVNNKLIELCRSYDLLRVEDVETVSGDDLRDYYLHFLSLVNRISESIEITPTKPLFCAYMGISTKIFNKWEKQKDNDSVKKWIDAINGDLTHSILDSSLNGNTSERVAMTFAATKDYGQETVQNNFSATIVTTKEVDYTPEQALAQANSTVALIAAMKKAAKDK